MSDLLKDLEYYSSIHNCYIFGEIIGIQEEDSYILKNLKDGQTEICDSDYIRKITNVSTEQLDNGTWELIIGEDEFLEVKIKEKKGLFYIVELTDDEGNTSTKIARQNQLRCINYIPFNDLIENKYTNIISEIPSEISSWIGSEKYNEFIEKIKVTATEDSQYSELFVTSYSVDEKSSLRIFCNADKEDIVNLILNTAIEGEKKLTYLNRDKENSKKELEEVKKKNKTIYIPQKLVGLIIGKDGINVKNLKNKYGVNITIDSKKENEKKPAEVIITGDDGAKVEECSKEIDVKQKIFEVSEACSIDIKKRANNLMKTYRIKRISVSNEEKKDDNDKVYKAPNIECIGNEEFIDEFYNNEIKDYDSYTSGGNYNNYNSSSSFRYNNNNRRYNNYYDYGYKNNYKSYKSYSSYNYY